MKISKIFTLFFLFGISQASAASTVIAQDNFDSLAAGATIAGPNWNTKWDGTETSQQNLYVGDGSGGVSLDTTVAFLNYHGLHQTGFTVDAAQPSVTISLGITYTHEAGGDITSNFNKAFFGPLISTQPQWWNGANDYFTLANRGGAVGNNVAGPPWIEGWNTHSGLGVNTTTGGTSSVITIDWELTSNGTTIDAQAVYTHAGGSVTSTKVDTGVAIGTTIYGGFSTGWNDQGNTTPISTFSKISSIGIDDFSICAVPEPSSILLLGFAGLGFLSRRSR